MRIILFAFITTTLFGGEPLGGTRPLVPTGDPAAQMVDGITAYLLQATKDSVEHRQPSRERLRKILGIVEPRPAVRPPEMYAPVGTTALLAQGQGFRVSSVRWPVLEGLSAEGLYFEPTGKVKAVVVSLPDADQEPERLRINQMLAAAGCAVLSPVLIDRDDTWSGNPRIRMTNQPHREFIYRMAFPVGRHILGYEVQKVLAAVDWFQDRWPGVPAGVWGYGEGGAVALFAAALDNRLSAAVVSGYFEPREGLWRQPLYRNVFGLLRDFGDAELAAMISPRILLIETANGPATTGPSEQDPKRKGAAPGSLVPASKPEVEREVRRAASLANGRGPAVSADASGKFLRTLGLDTGTYQAVDIPVRDGTFRQHEQFNEMVEFTQKVVRDSSRVRDALWSKAEGANVEKWQRLAPEYKARLWKDVIGRLPAASIALNVQTARNYAGAKWDGYDVKFDVVSDVFGYGVLLIPKDIRAGERRPVVVAQHGLEGRPQHLFGLEETDRDKGVYTNFHYYQNIGSKLADLGFVVYMPQNPYIGDFRKINRLANPLGLSLYSFILAQHDRMLDWLDSLPFVDPSRIGFYGLSYGGKTAVRVPPLLDRYTLSICSGDFNEWIVKLTTTEAPYTYMFTHEYEVVEFDLASVANHAEMAKMMAPRPFMVERGHRDGVGVDEWVAFEYAKVKRFYDEMGIGDRTQFEYFNGPHMIHGVGTIEFIRKYLGR